MNQFGSYRKKNWQWRIIIWSSLFLIFGKSLGHWIYSALALDQAYVITTSLTQKAGLTDSRGANSDSDFDSPPSAQLVVEVRNDTPNEYTIETRVTSGQVDYSGHILPVGNVKQFTLIPEQYSASKSGLGDIFFLSAPMAGSKNTTCQEIHTLNFNLKDAARIKQPLSINLSAIASRMECRDNSTQNSE